MLALLLATLSVSWAASVVVQTSVPVEVRVDGAPAVKTFGPSVVRIPDVEPGPHAFMVWRNGTPTTIHLEVPTEGTMRLMIGADAIEATDAAPSATDPTPPTVELRATQGQRFAAIVDGRRAGLITSDQPLRLLELGTGLHSLELRTEDLLVVWVRGTLDLQPGDALVVSAAEGRMVEVFGRTEAWRAAQAGQERPTSRVETPGTSRTGE